MLSCDLRQGHSIKAVTNDLLPVDIQRCTPNLSSLKACSPHACLDSLDDGLPLDLSNRSDDNYHRSTKWATGVNVLPQADELNAKVVEFVENFQEVAHIPSNSVERRHEHNIKAPTTSINK